MSGDLTGVFGPSGFNASEVDPAVGYEPVPAGRYIGSITETDVGPTKRGDGTLLSFVFKIASGQYAGRTIRGRMNIQNPNPQAEAIGKAQLSSLVRAIGYVGELRHTTVLHDRPVGAIVKFVPPKGEYSASNDIDAFFPANEQPPATQQAAPPQQAPWGQQPQPQQPPPQQQPPQQAPWGQQHPAQQPPQQAPWGQQQPAQQPPQQAPWAAQG